LNNFIKSQIDADGADYADSAGAGQTRREQFTRIASDEQNNDVGRGGWPAALKEICKGAYDNVISLFHNFGEYNWKEGCGYATVTDEKLVIIGYSRRFSIIRNKPALIELLKQFVQP